jgi:hypothetical protein
MATPKTHFQQIPVETVKELAKPFPVQNPVGNSSVSVEPQIEITSPHERWREVAQKVQEERDPGRMVELVQQLIATFDEEELRRRLPHTRDDRTRGGPSEV